MGGWVGGRAGEGGVQAAIKARKTKMTSSPHHYHQGTKFHDPTVNLEDVSPAGFDRNFHLLTRNALGMTVFGNFCLCCSLEVCVIFKLLSFTFR